MIHFYTKNKLFETKKDLHSYLRSLTFLQAAVPKLNGLLALHQSLLILKQTLNQAQKGKRIIRISCLFLLLAFSQLCQAQTLPSDGLYTFQGAKKNPDGTYTTADGFFLISGYNGSSAGASTNVSADQYGAFISDNATNTSGTSYLEIKVKNGGSFQVVGSVIGEYDFGNGGNNFFDVYAAGLVNGVEIVKTPKHSSIGVLEADYKLDFSAFAGKTIDAFRVYYSWNSGTSQENFNLQDMTIAGASLTPPSTLPLTWLSFTAKKQDKAVALNWSTAAELNTKDFLVQHSANARDWNSIGSVTAAGNSSIVQTYSFLHPFPVSGVNYYRLLQRDRDDKKSYSKVVTVDMAGSGQALLVYPNPVIDGTITVRLQNAATVQVYNNLGTMILQKAISGGGQQLNISRLPKGVYTVKAEGKTVSLIVQ